VKSQAEQLKLKAPLRRLLRDPDVHVKSLVLRRFVPGGYLTIPGKWTVIQQPSAGRQHQSQLRLELRDSSELPAAPNSALVRRSSRNQTNGTAEPPIRRARTSVLSPTQVSDPPMVNISHLGERMPELEKDSRAEWNARSTRRHGGLAMSSCGHRACDHFGTLMEVEAKASHGKPTHSVRGVVAAT
jgi:hypothetical protein